MSCLPCSELWRLWVQLDLPLQLHWKDCCYLACKWQKVPLQSVDEGVALALVLMHTQWICPSNLTRLLQFPCTVPGPLWAVQSMVAVQLPRIQLSLQTISRKLRMRGVRRRLVQGSSSPWCWELTLEGTVVSITVGENESVYVLNCYKA
mgnify:CR=1 FL=1